MARRRPGMTGKAWKKIQRCLSGWLFWKSPVLKMRPPSIHVPTVEFVVGAELPTQSWLFVKQNEDVDAQLCSSESTGIFPECAFAISPPLAASLFPGPRLNESGRSADFNLRQADQSSRASQRSGTLSASPSDSYYENNTERVTVTSLGAGFYGCGA